MKKLFSILLCYQLIMAPLAIAEGEATAPPPTELPSSGTPARAGDQHFETGLGSEGGYDFWTKQVLILGLNILGSNILTQCPEGIIKPSIMTFMAGSVTYISSEIFGAKAQNQKHKKNMSDIEMKAENMPSTGTQMQKDSMDRALQEEKDMLSFIESKRNWMIAISLIYTAAAGIAIGEQIYGMSAGLAAGASACSAQGSAFGAACGPAAVGCIPGHIAACTAASNIGSVAASAAFAVPDGRQVGGAACKAGPQAMYVPGCEAHLQAYLAAVNPNCSPLFSFQSSIINGILTAAVTGAYGLATSQIDGGGVITQGGMLLLSILPIFTTAVSTASIAAYNYPIPRAISFGAHALLGGVVIAGLLQREGAAKENIKNLQKVVDQFTLNSVDAIGIDEGPSAHSGDDLKKGPKSKKVKALAHGEKSEKECLGKDRKVSAAGCRNRLTLNKPNFSFGDGLETLETASSLGTDMANAATAGDLASVSRIAGEINAMGDRIKSVTNNLRKKYNEQLKAQGKAPIDFDKEMKNKVAELQQALKEAAASKGMSVPTIANAALDVTPEKGKQESFNEVAKPVAATPAAAIPGFDLGGLEEASEGEFMVPIEMAESGEVLEQYETSEADISKKSDVSIFIQLSHRYILNYNRIFDKRQVPAAGKK